MIKLIVVDMDGTLLNSKKEMPQGMFELIQKLHNMDVKFAVASGRQFFNIQQAFEPIANDMYFVAENGMYMFGDGKELMVHSLAKAEVQKFIAICRKIEHTYPVVCGKKSAYIEHDDVVFREHVAQYYSKCQVLDSLDQVDDEILKIAIFNMDGTEEHVYPHFKDFENEYMVSVSAQEWMDIMIKGVHKGNAIQELQSIYNIRYDETMLFGDFLNDYEMMQTGYHSYAMKNAHPEVKKVSNFETAYTNDEEGVKKEIERIFHIA